MEENDRLKAEFKDLKEHYTGLIEQHKLDMNDKKSLERSLEWQSNLYQIAILYIPEEKLGLMQQRIDLAKEGKINGKSNKDRKDN